jgi:hypothetical protein
MKPYKLCDFLKFNQTGVCMENTLVERYASEIDGVLSCLDRIVLTGTLTGVCYPAGMSSHLFNCGVKIFDYPDMMNGFREKLRENAEGIAAASGIEIEFIRNIDAFRKEAKIKEIIAGRGDAPGLVHVFSAMERCAAFEPWHNKKTHKTFLRNCPGKCLHYYFYFIDREFGVCYMRVPTWAPFRLQFYCNGHNWLASKLREEGIGYTQIENCLSHIDDWKRAQELSDSFPSDRLHRLCDRMAQRLCPVAGDFKTSWYWSIMQCEYSLDIAFYGKDRITPLYESLSRAAICAVKAPDVCKFLGRSLDERYKGELGSSFHTRVEGTCVKHHMGPASVKLYDKHGRVLRIETTCNDTTFFKHYRTVEHRDGTREKKFAPMQKSIYSLGPLVETLSCVNRRYLKFISELSDSSAGVDDVRKLSETVKIGGRGFGGFNVFAPDDLKLFQILSRGENNIAGFSNSRIRDLAPSMNTGKVSRILRRLHLHGLIKRATNTYHYYLTEFGRRTVLTALKLRELVVIPCLAGTY